MNEHALSTLACAPGTVPLSLFLGNGRPNQIGLYAYDGEELIYIRDATLDEALAYKEPMQ